jgi:AraC-like DNA-binding protein
MERPMDMELLKIDEPADYFSGTGRATLPTPTNVLLFLRETRRSLQQDALQNRSHHRFVLARNLETDGHVHLDHLTMQLKPGQAILILPYQFHHFSQLSSNHLKWLFCTFELQPRTFLEPLRNRVLDLGSKTQALYDELLSEWHAPHEELQAEQLQAVLLRLLLSLKQDRLRSATDLPPKPEDSLLQTINRLLAERSGRPVVVADLADALDYSESRLRAIFKEAAGVPLGSYIQNHRINRAMALLRTTKLPVAAVADDAGFGSPQAFSRIFKKETGQTPRAYRGGK